MEVPPRNRSIGHPLRPRLCLGLNVLYFPIFRVPEYSEYLLRTGFVLGFRWDELGILKRGEKGPLRIVGLAQRTGRIRCLNLRQRLFLESLSEKSRFGCKPFGH
jgi:hypothetical protein